MPHIHTDVRAEKLRPVIAMLWVLLTSILLFPGSALAGTGTAVSSFAASCYTPGAGVGVIISVTPDASTAYAVQDAPPSGWTVSNVSGGGSFDAVNNLVKWGPFFDSTARTLSYTATPPAESSGSESFSGVASFDGSSVSITGTRAITKCCSYTISPTSRSHEAGAATGSINVTGSSDCTWSAASSASWITITSGASGSGNGTVTYSVADNAGSSRSGIITIANQTFTVTQSGLYSISISPQSRAHSANAETGEVSVTAPPGANWVASSDSAWISITSGSSGNGNGTVYYSVSANPDTFERTGTLTIGDQTYTVTQAGKIMESQAAFISIFPQIAIGGPNTTYLTFAEPNGIPSKNIQIELFDDKGAAFKATFDNGSATSNYSFVLSSFQEKTIKLSDPGSITKAGWARVTSWPGKVDASIRFAYSDDPQELETDVVGALPTEKISYWTVTVDQQKASGSVGIAVVNPNNTSIDVQFELWSNGTRVPDTQMVTRNIAANGHIALFVDQLFATRFAGIGTLTVYANGAEINVMVLRYDGIQSSTLPANKLSEIWNWSAGSNELGGKFYINMQDSGSFIGLETTNLGLQDESTMRGYLSGSRFMAERPYKNSETDKGVVLYIGTQTGSGRNATISGTRFSIRDNGAVLSTKSFTAQRTN